MKKLLLSLAVLSLLQNPGGACDKCGRPQHVMYAAPSYAATTMAVAPMQMTYAAPTMLAAQPTFAAQTTFAAPMTYAAPMTFAAPTTFQTTSASSLQFVQAQPSTVSVAPMYYTAAPVTQSIVSTQAVAAPQTVYYTVEAQPTMSAAQTQGFVSDLLIGLARPAACEVCRNLGCGTNGGNSSTDPIANLRDTIKEIGILIKSVKGLEKDIKDAVDGNASNLVEPPVSSESQIATLTQLRDDIRALNANAAHTRIADGKP